MAEEERSIDLADPRMQDPGLFAKVLKGGDGWKELNDVDGMRFVGLLSMKATGAIGAIGGFADTAADFVEINRERAALEETLNIRRNDIDLAARNEADDEDATKRAHAVGKGVAITGASMATVGAVASVVSGPLGWIAGVGTAVVTSMLTGMGYDKLFVESMNDSLGLSGKLLFAQMQGVEIPEEAAFAAWAASQPKGVREQMERRLGELTDGEVTHFGEALAKNKTEALRKLMEESDSIMRIDPKLDLDERSEKSAAAQLAEKMNARKENGEPEFVANRLISQDHLEAALEVYAKAHGGKYSATDNRGLAYPVTDVDGFPPSATDNTGLPPIPRGRGKNT